jgi:hypothetical protein
VRHVARVHHVNVARTCRARSAQQGMLLLDPSVYANYCSSVRVIRKGLQFITSRLSPDQDYVENGGEKQKTLHIEMLCRLDYMPDEVFYNIR